MSVTNKIEQFIANYSENNKTYHTAQIINQTHEFIVQEKIDIINVINEMKLSDLQKYAIAYNIIDFIILNSNDNKIINNIDINYIKYHYLEILNKFHNHYVYNNISNKIIDNIEDNKIIENKQLIEDKIDQNIQDNENKIDQKIKDKVIKINKLKKENQEQKIIQKNNDEINEYNKNLFVGYAKKLPKVIKNPIQKKEENTQNNQNNENKIEQNAKKTDMGYLFFNEFINKKYLNILNNDGTPIGWSNITNVIIKYYYDEINDIINDEGYDAEEFQYFKSSGKIKIFHGYNIKEKFWFHFNCELINENENPKIENNSIKFLDENELYNNIINHRIKL
jgi:hypothetical protein